MNSDEDDIDTQIHEILQVARAIYMTNNPKYKCGIKRELTKTHLLSVKEINQKLNKQKLLFDMEIYVSELNKVSDTKIDTMKQEVMVSDFILNWFQDIFIDLTKELNQKEFKRGFKNFLFLHTILNLLKPVKLLKFPHYHLRLPIVYYESLFDYESVLKNDRNLKLTKMESIFKLSNKKNCAHSTYSSFSTSNSIEQLELQVFFLKKKFSFEKKLYAQNMLSNLIETALQIINSQKWIKDKIKLNIQTNIEKLQKTIAYSDLVDDSIKSNRRLTNGQSDEIDLTK